MAKQLDVADVIMHTKTSDKSDVITLPVTRYGNVMNAPNVITDPNEKPGAPFHLLVTESEEIDDNLIRSLCGPIV